MSFITNPKTERICRNSKLVTKEVGKKERSVKESIIRRRGQKGRGSSGGASIQPSWVAKKMSAPFIIYFVIFHYVEVCQMFGEGSWKLWPYVTSSHNFPMTFKMLIFEINNWFFFSVDKINGGSLWQIGEGNISEGAESLKFPNFQIKNEKYWFCWWVAAV